MVHDILVIGRIYEYQIEYFFDQIKEAVENDPDGEFTIWLNSNGGNPECGMTLIRKIQQISDRSSILADGSCHSMAAFALCYVDDVDCSDTAQFLIHRATYGEWYESRPDFPESIAAQSLAMSNKDLEKAFRAKIDVEAFEALPKMKEKGMTVKSIFSMDGREEVLLSAAEAKKIGLVKTITKLIPSKAAKMQAYAEAFRGCDSVPLLRKAAEAIEKKKDEPKNENKIMTLAELKEKHPSVYAEAVAEGEKAGITKERDRVEAAMVYADVDPDGVKKIIEGGQQITAKQMAELNRKMMSSAALGKIEKEAAGEVITEAPEGPQSDKAKKLAAFEKDLDASLKLIKK